VLSNVYIDAFNLYYGALKGKPYKWLDLAKLCELLLPKNNIQKIKYFTALVGSRPDRTGSDMRQLAYLRALGTVPNLAIIKGHYLSHPARMPTYASYQRALQKKGKIEFVQVLKTEEKGSDVNLASHLLHDGCRKEYEVAVVISNDSDLLEPIRIVKEELKIPVGVINPGQIHPSQVLLKMASFFKTIRGGVLAASQFPPVMRDSNGEFHKPDLW
jgi:uncharacterized LabA/DUF88 family protein